MRKWLLLALLLFPIFAFASSNTGGSGGVFSVAPTDKSMQYLSYAFGNVPGTPIQSDKTQVSTGNKMPVMQNIFYVFNQVIFALGILVVVYTTVVGTVMTAQEGEFLGKQKWHPILVPLRAALGVYVLLPSTSGYNWIQMALIWFIVQGVGAANALWKQVIYFNQSQGSIHNDTRKANLLQAGNTTYAIFNSDVCMMAMNANPTASNLLGEPITIYQWKDKIEWGRQSKAGKEQPLCGSVTIPNVSSNIFSSTNDAANLAQRTAILSQAVIQAAIVLLSPSMEALYGNGSNTVGPTAFVTAATVLNDAVRSLSNTFQTLDQINQQAIDDGWIFAGSYYFQIIQGAGVAVNVAYSSKGPDSNTINGILGTSLGSEILTTAAAAADNYAAVSSASINLPVSDQPQLQLNSSGPNGGHVGSLFAAMFGSLMDTIVNAVNTTMTQGEGDPLLSMATFGAYLTTTCEITFWSVLAIYFVIFMGTSVFHCFNPLGPAIDLALRFFIPMAILVISLFYLAGITLALYVPLIPYLVFTFTAFGWMVLVIESMLGASLVGLSLVIPSEDELGKAAHAVMILLGLFLRPALMILGFILGIQLLYVAFKMLNFGFWKTLVSSTGASSGVGVFGMVAVLTMYAGIAATLTHEAFSLIYVLPNKVMRWIGGGGEEEFGQQVKALKGSVQKGGEISKGAMTGIMGKGQQKLSGSLKK